jgi:hypothetical protein
VCAAVCWSARGIVLDPCKQLVLVFLLVVMRWTVDCLLDVNQRFPVTYSTHMSQCRGFAVGLGCFTQLLLMLPTDFL